jgi:hypothetical protein
MKVMDLMDIRIRDSLQERILDRASLIDGVGVLVWHFA